MKKVLGFVMGALLLLGASRAAHAGGGYGYVCDVEDLPTSFGTYGAVFLNVYSGPSCTGSYVGSGYLCSTGATSSSCSGVGYQRTEAQLIAIDNRLQQAAIANEKIYYWTDANSNPLSIYFYAAGY